MRSALFSLIFLVVALGAGEARAFVMAPDAHGAADGNSAVRTVASSASENVNMRVIVSRKIDSADASYIAFRLRIEGLPTDKKYQFFLQDMGMKRDGLPPAPVIDKTTRWTPDEEGSLEFRFELDHFVKGEWVQYTIRSIDGEINKTVRFVPFK